MSDQPSGARAIGVPRDEAWFDALFTDHARAVHAYLARRAGHQDAEDLAADVFTTAWRRRGDVPEGYELPWLYRTAGFVLANHRRKHQPVPVEEIDDGDTDAADPATMAIKDAAVVAALQALRPRDRKILLLHAWEGLDGTELAEALGISRGGAAAALSRARSRLDAVWNEHAGGSR